MSLAVKVLFLYQCYGFYLFAVFELALCRRWGSNARIGDECLVLGYLGQYKYGFGCLLMVCEV